MSGKVYLVGAGPWDPGLITLRGHELLGRADVVIHDYLSNPRLLEFASASAEIIATGEPPHRMSQREISDLLVEKGRCNSVVVRLKGGDPFVFGRGGEEAEALVRAGVEFEVVPGVTAAVASAAYAGIPVTHRDFGSTLAFCTGHFRDDGPDDGVNWDAVSQMDTVIFYMAARRLGRLSERLVAAGLDAETPVALVRWATRPDQETVITTVAEMSKVQLAPPLTVIVGKIVDLRREIGWYEARPLHGLSVVVTRSRGQAGFFSRELREMGADVVECPTIAFEVVNAPQLEAILKQLGDFDWVLFTSANAVEYFFAALQASGRDARAFRGAQIGCVGPATATALECLGIQPDMVPDRFIAEGLSDALASAQLNGKRVLIPRAEVARDILPDTLRELGAEVHVLPVYRTVACEDNITALNRIKHTGADLVTFTASSTVRHFCALFSPEELQTLQSMAAVACIGPVTEETARRHGFRVDVSAEDYTIAGLTKALKLWGEARHAEVI